MEAFFVNPLTPELYVFTERMPHSVAVALRKKPFEKLRWPIPQEKAFKAAVAEIEALKVEIEGQIADAAILQAKIDTLEAAAAEAATATKKPGK